MISARVKDFLVNLTIASILAAFLFAGFFFREQIKNVSYSLVGKLFPGPRVKVTGTEVEGFINGKKVDHLAGVVKNIEPFASGTRLTIEWEDDEEIVLIDSKAPVYFGSKNISENRGDFNQGTIDEVKVDDYAMLDAIERMPNGENKAKFVIIVR